MNSKHILSEYLRLSDIMYQALKVKKYEIFENVMKERGELVERASHVEGLFGDLKQSEKDYYRQEMKNISLKIEEAMSLYRKTIEGELAKVHAGRANLRRRSNAKKYYGSSYENQGNFINKLR